MPKRRILIVDNSDELRVSLADVLGKLGHEVVATGDRATALARPDLEEFDLIISDLTEDASPAGELQRKHLLMSLPPGTLQPDVIKAFKLGATNYLRSPYNDNELREIIPGTKRCSWFRSLS